MLPFTVKVDTFLCPEFKCPDCGWDGVLEVKTTAFVTPELGQRTFRPGDSVMSNWIGEKEVFDGGLCPRCIERGLVKILPVTLIFESGVFVRAHF